MSHLWKWHLENLSPYSIVFANWWHLNVRIMISAQLYYNTFDCYLPYRPYKRSIFRMRPPTILTSRWLDETVSLLMKEYLSGCPCGHQSEDKDDYVTLWGPFGWFVLLKHCVLFIKHTRKFTQNKTFTLPLTTDLVCSYPTNFVGQNNGVLWWTNGRCRTVGHKRMN